MPTNLGNNVDRISARSGYAWYGRWGKDVAAAYEQWQKSGRKINLMIGYLFFSRDVMRSPRRGGQIAWLLLALLFSLGECIANDALQGALAGERYRIMISTDIGGSDPDDFQSMIHFLLYADLFDTEGMISSPWGKGRKQDILDVLDIYEKDYFKLKTRDDFPSPASLRSITKQGETERAPFKGFREATEGSNWIITCAQRDDPRPLYLLVWGLLEDVAQALHDAPQIQDKLRVIYIGGPNKKWGADAYDYIEQNFAGLWMVENNSTYRGFWVGGKQAGDLSNDSFYDHHIKDHGSLGNYFGKFYGGEIKMGDSPTLLYLMAGNPEQPGGESWGGSFQAAKHRPKFSFERHTTLEDQIEVFSIVEWRFKGPDTGAGNDERQFQVEIDGQFFEGYYAGGGNYSFRWCPKAVGKWSYKITSPHQFLHGKTGQFTTVPESTLSTLANPVEHANWWTDRFDPSLKEQGHAGIKTVNRWREQYLRHWQKRLDWLK